MGFNKQSICNNIWYQLPYLLLKLLYNIIKFSFTFFVQKKKLFKLDTKESQEKKKMERANIERVSGLLKEEKNKYKL